MDKIAHVLDLDRQRIQAMIQRDSTKLMALLADDVFFIHETFGQGQQAEPAGGRAVRRRYVSRRRNI